VGRMRDTVLAMMILAVLGSTAGSVASAQDAGGGADREWRFIEKLREDGMQDLALRQLEVFSRDFADDPRAPGALLLAAEGEAALGRPMRARQLCEELLQRFPSSVQAAAAALLRADQLSDEARFDAAATAYRDLLSAYPGSPETGPARLGLGEALMSLGRDDEARRLFAGLLGPESSSEVSARARFDLGVLEVQAGADSLAIVRFESIHLQHPDQPIGAFGLVRAAELLVQREATEAAAERYELVIERYENPVLRARARLGLASLVEESDPERAVELYRAVLEEGAAHEDLQLAYLGLGRSALAAGDSSLAGSIATAFLERFPDEPEADQARLIRARALLEDEPEMGVTALSELGRSTDPDVAWTAMEILARRDSEAGNLDQAALRWRQAEAHAADNEMKARALLEQTRIALQQERHGLAADLALLIPGTTGVDSLAARGLQLAGRAKADGGQLEDAIALARRCSREYPLTAAAADARAELALWSRMNSADANAAAEALAALALDDQQDPAARALAVATIQRDLLADYETARPNFRNAADAAKDPAAASHAELGMARNAQLAALAAGLRGDGREARARLREARDALVSVAARGAAPDLATQGRIGLFGLDLAAAARPDAPWLFDPRTMPLLGAVGPAEEVDPHAPELADTRRRIEAALEEAGGDALAWLAWRAAELSTAELEHRFALLQTGLAAVDSEELRTGLRYTRGQLLLLDDQPAEAARDLAAVIEQQDLIELSLAARYALAEAHRSLKRYDQAGELYVQFAAAFPNTRRGQRAMLLAGDCALFAGQPDRAVDSYRTLLNRYPDSVYRDDTLYRLGTALERAGKIEAARRPLWLLVDDDGASQYRGRALARLGRIEESAGQDSLAVVVLTRLVQEDPERAAQEDARLRLAELELARQQPAQALEWAQSQPEGSGDSARATALQVRAYATLGRTAEAADRLEQLSLAHPDRPELVAGARVVLAEGLVTAGDDTGAREEFVRAGSESSDDETRAHAAFGRAMVDVRAQRWAEATAGLESVLQIAPDSEWAAEALFKLGQLYLRDSDTARARGAFARLAQDFPAHERAPAALKAEARVWRQEGRFDRAIETYHRILEDYPEESGGEQVLASIAYCHHETGQYELSIASYERVMPLLAEEDQAYAQFWIADSLDQLGRYEEAATAFLRIPYLYSSMGQLAVTAQLKAGEAWEHQGDVDAARTIYERVLQAQGAGTQWGEEASRRLQRLERATGG